MLRRVFRPYWEWEDYQAGMFDGGGDSQKARELLTDSERFFSVSIEMVAAWPVAALVNLTDTSRNRRSWVGQAACCFAHNVSEQETRKAWGMLSGVEQRAANQIADRVIHDFERTHCQLHRNVGEALLF